MTGGLPCCFPDGFQTPKHQEVSWLDPKKHTIQTPSEPQEVWLEAIRVSMWIWGVKIFGARNKSNDRDPNENNNQVIQCVTFSSRIVGGHQQSNNHLKGSRKFTGPHKGHHSAELPGSCSVGSLWMLNFDFDITFLNNIHAALSPASKKSRSF